MAVGREGAHAERLEPLQRLTTATTRYREMDMGFWLTQAEAVLKEVS